uniref:MSP domain-containing protein n=1 Tax=Aegilops tauschii subsp. strangulata TaxID=200361 RepID=A0A453CFC5_AEGTS
APRAPLPLRVHEADLVLHGAHQQDGRLPRLQGQDDQPQEVLRAAQQRHCAAAVHQQRRRYCQLPYTSHQSHQDALLYFGEKLTLSDFSVTMQALKQAPPDMQCKDKFLVQSAVVTEGTAVKDITGEMFKKESGNVVDEVRLKVVYVQPPRPPSPVREGSEEGSSPRPSWSDGANINYQDATRESDEPPLSSVSAQGTI